MAKREEDLITDVPIEMEEEVVGAEGVAPTEEEILGEEEIMAEVPPEIAAEGEAVSGLTLTPIDYPGLSDMNIGDRVTLEVADIDEARENFMLNFIEV